MAQEDQDVVQERAQAPPPGRIPCRVPPQVARDLDSLPSFEKEIHSRNQHHNTARRGLCELCVNRRFARDNGIDKDRELLFVTRSLIENGKRFMRMKFRSVDHNDGNFVIRHGWREFSEYHDIKIGWTLRFTLTAPNQLYARRVKPVLVQNESGDYKWHEKPVRL